MPSSRRSTSQAVSCICVLLTVYLTAKLISLNFHYPINAFALMCHTAMHSMTFILEISIIAFCYCTLYPSALVLCLITPAPNGPYPTDRSNCNTLTRTHTCSIVANSSPPAQPTQLREYPLITVSFSIWCSQNRYGCEDRKLLLALRSYGHTAYIYLDNNGRNKAQVTIVG